MINKIKAYFNRKKEEKAAFEQFKKDKFIQESEKPYFTLEGKDLVKEGIQIEMDWNNACIQALRKLGFNGITDEAVLEKYLHRVFETAAAKAILQERGVDIDEES